MQMDAEVAAMVELLDKNYPDVTQWDPAELRAFLSGRRPPLSHEPAVAQVHNLTIEGPGGDLPLRIFRPTEDADLPVILFAHGGGFVICDLDSHDEFCRSMANGVGAVVVAVDYRLAPEHRAPAAHDDFYAALEWAAANIAEYGGDPSTIALVGDSAGGNLAATVAIAARDRGGPKVTAQGLLYAVIDDDFETDSYQRFGKGYFNDTTSMQWYWDQYAPADQRNDPRITPTAADSLAGLPTAVILAAGMDVTADSNDRYAERLVADGVTVLHKRHDGLFHGFLTIPALSHTATVRAELWTMLREALGLT